LFCCSGSRRSTRSPGWRRRGHTRCSRRSSPRTTWR
jgi:hypothetical protein